MHVAPKCEAVWDNAMHQNKNLKRANSIKRDAL